MVTSWDINAELRHRQMVDGTDVTFSKLLLPKILEILKSFEGSGSFSVLDVGCGTGVLSHFLSDRVKSVWGIDPSLRSIDIARDYTKDDKNVRFECCAIEEFAASHADEFDLILGHMVVQTIQDLAPALQGISRVLKLGNSFVLSLPHPCFWALIKKDIGNENYAYHLPSSHEIYFPVKTAQGPLPGTVSYYHRSLETYSAALSEAGFVIERMYEPFPDEALMSHYPRAWVYPGFLVIVCRKLHA